MRGRHGGTRRLAVAAAAVLAGCGPAIHDPAFEEAALRDLPVGDCGAGRCVEIVAVVTGNRLGEGRCAVYEPGDPDDLEPIAVVDGLTMDPARGTVEQPLRVDTDVPTDRLNLVCSPMVEG